MKTNERLLNFCGFENNHICKNANRNCGLYNYEIEHLLDFFINNKVILCSYER